MLITYTVTGKDYFLCGEITSLTYDSILVVVISSETWVLIILA